MQGRYDKIHAEVVKLLNSERIASEIILLQLEIPENLRTAQDYHWLVTAEIILASLKKNEHYPFALNHLNEAISYLKKEITLNNITENRFLLASLYHSRAAIFLKNNNVMSASEEAICAFNLYAYAVRENYPVLNNTAFMFDVQKEIADALYDGGEFIRATWHYNRVIRILKDNPSDFSPTYKTQTADTHGQLANCFWENDQIDQSLQHYEHQAKILESLQTNASIANELLRCYAYICKIYICKKDLANAEEFFYRGCKTVNTYKPVTENTGEEKQKLIKQYDKLLTAIANLDEELNRKILTDKTDTKKIFLRQFAIFGPPPRPSTGTPTLPRKQRDELREQFKPR